MQTSTVASLAAIARTRCSELMPPPGMISAPSLRAPSQALQKPMKGPNEKAKKMRSPLRTPAPAYTSPQQRPHQSQLPAVSSQRRRSPVVPEVRCRRVYWSRSKVRLVPYGGLPAWSRESSSLVVNGSRA